MNNIIISKKMPKKKTTEEFIKDAIKVHGDKYDYSKVEYIKSCKNVIIICKIHGDFLTNPGNHINSKSGCPMCAGNKSYTIEYCQKIATEKGGECLSKEYKTKDSLLEWKCKEGHIFKKRLGHIREKAWCPKCTGKQKYTIEECCTHAVNKKGKCLSNEYINSSTLMEWECKERHCWKNTFGHIKHGQWCPYCSGKFNNNIELCNKIANEKGGECISKNYLNSSTKMKWKCKEGHIWDTNFENIKLSDSWCPTCACNKSYTIEYCQKIATEKDGECLSKEYKNSKEYMLWKCGEKHTFKSKFYNIKVRNNWCPKCLLCPSCNLWRTMGILCIYCKPKNENRLYRKTKEYIVVKYLKENLPDYDFIHNKSVGNECTKDDKEKSNGHLYPDIRFECGHYNLIVEVDENKHRGSDYKCEEQRMYNIIAKLGLPCIFIRYNPDSKESNREILLEKIKEYLELDIDDKLWDDYGFMVEYLFY